MSFFYFADKETVREHKTKLILLGIGVAFAISWPVALAVVGSILVLVSLWLSTPARKNGREG